MNVPNPDEVEETDASKSEQEVDQLNDEEEVQAAYRKAFREQMRQLGCPGCGDDNPFV